MPDYILLEAALLNLREELGKENLSNAASHYARQGIATAISVILHLPAADVVEVVRCGECIHRVNMEHSKEICCGRMAMRVMALDDYCSHGVRIDGGEHHAD